jgi:transcriptional regulator of acetoin/glycerol metabolism
MSPQQAALQQRGGTMRSREQLARRLADAVGPESSTLEQVEREHIVRVLREAHGAINTAAGWLGLPRTTVNAKMRKLGISRKDL